MPKKEGLTSPLFGLVSLLLIRISGLSVLHIGGCAGARVNNTPSNKLKLKAVRESLCLLVCATAIVGPAGLKKCIS